MDMLSELKEVVYQKLGIQLHHIAEKELIQKINALILQENMENEKTYLLKLNVHSIESAIWKNLITEITNTETFFFRDQGLFTLLENNIYPSLLENSKDSIRLWSAGCSTGEEAYSLAILFHKNSCKRTSNSNVFIYASDVNEEALQKAQKGHYGDWSFRGMDTEDKCLYFEKEQRNWKIKREYQKLVSFFFLNLADKEYPTHLNNLDMIICRNVFIYMSESVIEKIVKKICSLLREGGYLITGHGELSRISLPSELKAKSYKEAIIYQKSSDKVENIAKHVPENINFSKKYSPQREYNISPTITGANTVIKVQNQEEDYFAKAQRYADQEKYSEAILYCEKAKEKDPFNEKIYYLLSQIALEQKNEEESFAFLQKSIYINSSFIPAHLDLANLYYSQQNFIRSQKMYEKSLELMSRIPGDKIIEMYSITVNELSKKIKKLVEQKFSH